MKKRTLLFIISIFAALSLTMPVSAAADSEDAAESSYSEPGCDTAYVNAEVAESALPSEGFNAGKTVCADTAEAAGPSESVAEAPADDEDHVPVESEAPEAPESADTSDIPAEVSGRPEASGTGGAGVSGGTSLTSGGSQFVLSEVKSADMNGFTAIIFTINDRYEVLITGIDPSTSEDVLAAIANDTAARFIDGLETDSEQDYSIENSPGYDFKNGHYADPNITYDVNVIDAEKRSYDKLDFDKGDLPNRERSDSLHCWAASAADMLWYSGWAKQAVNPLSKNGECFKSEDEVFAWISECFEDEGYWQESGILYFFNGINQYRGTNLETELYDYAEDSSYYKGGEKEFFSTEDNMLLNEYSVSVLEKEYGAEIGEDFRLTLVNAVEELKNGAAVGIDIRSGYGYSGAHALTVFGYIKDILAETVDSIKGLFIADSDNDVLKENEILTAPDDLKNPESRRNSYQFFLTESCDNYIITSLLMPNYYHSLIDTVNVLKPCTVENKAAALESDSQATINPKNTPDIIPLELYTADSPDFLFPVESYEAGSTVYLTLNISNIAETGRGLNNAVSADTPVSFTFTLYSVSGSGDTEKLTRVKSVSGAVSTGLASGEKQYAGISVDGLQPGQYKLVLTELNGVSGDGLHPITEAYYVNNLAVDPFYFSVLGSPSPDSGNGAPASDTCSGPKVITVYFDSSSDTGLTITVSSADVSGTAGRFSVWRGSELLVQGEDYEIEYGENGELLIILTEDYMKTLPNGTHRLRVVTDGRTFYVDVVVAVKPQ